MSSNNISPQHITRLAIDAIHTAEKTKLPGQVKQTNATNSVMDQIKGSLNPADILKYAGLVYALIKEIVGLYNKFFGKNGWSEED